MTEAENKDILSVYGQRADRVAFVGLFLSKKSNNQSKSQNRNSSKGRKDNKSDKKCDYCERIEHLEDRCYYLHPDIRPDDWQPAKDKKKLLKDKPKESSAKAIRTLKASYLSRKSNIWWIDSGADDHLCFDDFLPNLAVRDLDFSSSSRSLDKSRRATAMESMFGASLDVLLIRLST